MTAVVTGLSISQPVPASVKIGYAASTGGSTNYHEIRNLLIDPLQTDIDLVMTKTVSSPSVTQGGPVVYTLTARNYGPYTSGTATNMPITDTIPALLTGATWTCAATGAGASCGAASGSGNINTTATLPFNTAVNYTIRSTVSATAPLGTTITNTASLTTPTGITDYNSGNNSASVDVSVTGAPVTLSGRVYSDANHNNSLDGVEASTGVAGIWAKLFRSSDLTTALSVTSVVTTAGTFTFTNVPSYGNYTIILSNNNTATDPTPAFPSANWIYTFPVNYTLSTAVTNTSVSGLNFGVYFGSRLSGKVINDNGLNGAPSNANDGILNAAETGISGAVVSLLTTTGLQLDSAATAGNGEFVLYTNNGSVNPLWIRETNLAGYVSVNYNAGNTGGVYSVATDSIAFNYTLSGNNATGGYKNILFSDVPANTFLPTPLAQNGLQGNTVYYGHTFTPGSGGIVSFVTSTRATTPSTPAWTAPVYYRDTNCNGTFDGTDSVLPSSLSTTANTPICILVRDTVPGSATLGTTHAISTRATFTYANAIGPITVAATVVDTTSVNTPGSVSVSGTVYNDANHSGLRDAGENSSNIAGIYAKLFRSSDLTTMLSVTSVVQSSGTYTFTFVPPNDTYTVILSSTSTATFDPSFPNTQWVATSPANYTLGGVAVGGADLANQNFGVFNGTRIDGQVLKDDGAAISANANNGVQNAGETGIAGQTVSICDNTSCVAIDTESTDANGFFSLYVPAATVLTTARITQTTMPAGYNMVNYNPGTPAAASGVNLGSRYITRAFTTGTDVTGVVFSDVPVSDFSPTPQADTGVAGGTVDYSHTFTPGSGGTVRFSTVSRSQGGWPALAYYRDVDCDGIYTAGTDTTLSLVSSLTATANTQICILVRESIAGGATPGQTDQIVTRATFTYTNSFGPVAATFDVTDTVTVMSGVGNKPLYLYSAPSYTLSRTRPAAGSAAVRINRGASQTWTELPALELPVTISNTLSLAVPVTLNLAPDRNAAYTYTVFLYCSSAPTNSLQASGTTNASTTITAYTVYLPFTAPIPSMTCAKPSSWTLRINHTGVASATRWIDVYPDNGGVFSNVSLPSLNVINVDSVKAYSAAYPSTSTPLGGYYSGGAAVYARAVVSDPFGSYDIDANTPSTLPLITIRDPNNVTVVSAATMTALSSATTPSTKTFEYAFTVPATGLSGTWTASVTAPEGTENLVSHTGSGSFRVLLLPNIVIAKSMQTLSDPYNFGTNPKNIPGATMLYSVLVTNQGNGTADSGTIWLEDAVPANTELFVGDLGLPGSGPVAFSDGSTSSGLSYTFIALGSGADSIEFSNTGPPYSYGYPPNPVGGYDPAVTSIRVKMGGVFAATGGAPYPSFTLQFRVRVK